MERNKPQVPLELEGIATLTHDPLATVHVAGGTTKIRGGRR